MGFKFKHQKHGCAHFTDPKTGAVVHTARTYETNDPMEANRFLFDEFTSDWFCQDGVRLPERYVRRIADSLRDCRRVIVQNPDTCLLRIESRLATGFLKGYGA